MLYAKKNRFIIHSKKKNHFTTRAGNENIKKNNRKSQKYKVRTSDRRCYKIELFIKEEALRRGSPGFIICI